jgi:glycogen operon protein
MNAQDWSFPEGKFLAYVLDGGARAPLYVVLNAAGEAISFKLPQWPGWRGWNPLVDTTVVDGGASGKMLDAASTSEAPPCSILVFEGVK